MAMTMLSAETCQEIESRNDETVRQARVLVVDDDGRARRLMTSLLGARGYEVVAASGGQEALGALAGGPFDLLLLDATMPGTSGFEVCERLRSETATRIPIVMVTELNCADEKVRALECGADDFLSKPINRVELLARVGSLLRVKRLRDEVEEARRDLLEKEARLRSVESRRTALTQMIVHDLRAPLTGVMGHAQILRARNEAQVPWLAKSTDGILSASKHMQRMLADLLDVSLFEENRLSIRPERTPLRELARAAIEESRAHAASSEVALGMDECGASAAAIADPGMMQRVFANLIANAIKHTASGGRVNVRVGDAADGEVEIHVTDTGEGSAAAPLETGAGNGDRGEGSTPAARQDRGLGLTFCRMAIEAHGGRARVDPVSPSGSCFVFVLPVDGPAERGAPPGPASRERERT